jgi:hypothetical protein
VVTEETPTPITKDEYEEREKDANPPRTSGGISVSLPGQRVTAIVNGIRQ